MGGASDDDFVGPSIDEQREDIAALLAVFDPTTSDRYTRVERRVHLRPSIFRRGKVTDTYPVAWLNSLSPGSTTNNPLSVHLHATLHPMVWATNDRQLLRQDPVIEDWTVTTLEKVPTWLYKSLQLGLRGDFTTIDREFEAARQEHAATTVDRIIREFNGRHSSPLATILLPPSIDTSATDFEQRRQQCIDALLRGESLSN